VHFVATEGQRHGDATELPAVGQCGQLFLFV
jgi:hypothetical protein